ncbi:response regulator [Mucilaginibacter sp. CSA2-8R]|uniref:response regulator n=1 Tax=Mucilaginibacter sp. CSA2-8R TaxID=3141542 RepID=UPI00315CD1C9
MKAEDLHLKSLYFKKLWDNFYEKLHHQRVSYQFLPTSKQGAKSQILIVDSEWNMLKLLYSVLKRQYQLVIKHSPIEAMIWLEEGNSPSLIICEYGLPHFDKASFVQLIKTSGFYKSTPIIVLSETENLEQKVSSLPFKVNAMLQKPFNPLTLLTVIKSLLHEPKLTIAS